MPQCSTERCRSLLQLAFLVMFDCVCGQLFVNVVLNCFSIVFNVKK